MGSARLTCPPLFAALSLSFRGAWRRSLGVEGMAGGGRRAEKEEEGGRITPGPVSAFICAHTIDVHEPAWQHVLGVHRPWVLSCPLEPCGNGLGISGRKRRGFPPFCATKGRGQLTLTTLPDLLHAVNLCSLGRPLGLVLGGLTASIDMGCDVLGGWGRSLEPGSGGCICLLPLVECSL